MNYMPAAEIEANYWNVHLPEYVDDSRIGVNMRFLQRLSRLACHSDEVHVNGYQGDTTEYTPMIVGGDSQGNAFAGVGAVKKARLGEADLTEGHPLISGSHDRPALNLRINVEEMMQRVQHGKARLRDPAVWANQLNAAVGEGVRQAAWNHLVRQPHYGEAGTYMIGRLFGLAAFGLPTWDTLATSLPVHNLSRLFMARYVDNRPLRDTCWSLTPVIHPDRAIAVSALTRTRKIVKALDHEPDPS
jgi:hypothetical protein